MDVSPAELAKRAVHRRAVEAVIWGIPAVNSNRMHDAMVAADGDFNQIVCMPVCRIGRIRRLPRTPTSSTSSP
jgi:hypothetical protein